MTGEVIGGVLAEQGSQLPLGQTKEKWETPDFEVLGTAFEASMYVYTR